MSLTFRYSDPLGVDEDAVLTDLGTEVIRFGRMAVSQSAEIGQPTISGVEIDDPDGSLLFAGLRAFYVTETSAPSNNQVIGRYVIEDRRVQRASSMRTGPARRWTLDLVDYNWLLSSRVLVDSDAKRPDETAGDRLRWLLNSAAHVSFNDYGNVSYPSDQMEDNDYRGQRASDVLADIAVESGYTFWCEYNEAHHRPELFFLNPNGTSYSSSLRISNDYSDYDGSVTFLPYEDAVLTRSASRIAFGVYLAYAKGSVYVRNQTTGAQFAKIDQTAPMANVRREARARRIANHFLNDNDEEDDRITCAIKVPVAQVNDIRAGHRLQAKFTHLPGYEDFTWMRVLRRTVIQEEEGGGHRGAYDNTEAYYKLELELSPTGVGGAVSCSTALSGVVVAVDETNDPGLASASITPTSGADAAVIVAMVARNTHVIDAHDAALGAPATTVYADETDSSPFEHPTWAIGYDHLESPSGAYTYSGTYDLTGNGNPSDSAAVMALASIRTAATTPVQTSAQKFTTAENGKITLGVTAGNMLVMVVTLRDETPLPLDQLYPTSGWTSLVTGIANTAVGPGDSVGIYARCVTSDDGSLWGVNNAGSNSHSVTLMEWALT